MQERPFLYQYKAGEQVVLTEVLDKELSIQLFTMGFLPGETIQIEKIAPFGDPMIISANDSFISLRRDDAKKVSVKAIES